MQTLAVRFAAAASAALALLVAPSTSAALDPPPDAAKSIAIDGRSVPTDGKIVTIDGNRVLFDGKPAIVDGKPLVITGQDVTLDGRPVAQKGQWLGRPALLLFTVDTRWANSSQYRIERDITTPIEQALKTIPGVLGIHSSIVGSRAQTLLSFAPSTDATTTESTIRLRLDQIRFRLPHDASRPLIAWHRETAAPAPASYTRDE